MKLSPKSVASTGSLALCLIAGAAGTAAPAQAAGSPVVGHTYVNDNAIGANHIAGFDRHADGSLTPIPGSPFLTGGSGTGRGLGSQGAIQLSADGRHLLAVDPGSDDVAVLRIGAGGVPRPVGPPVASGGVTPVSITVHDDLVYVANSGDGGSGYSGFTLDRNGRLTPLAGSTVRVPDGAGLADVTFDPTGDRLIGTRDGPAADISKSLIDSFKVHGDGRIKAAKDSPFPSLGNGPIGAQFSPTEPSQLFVSNAHDGAGLGNVAAFDVARSGALSPIGAGTFPDFQTAPCWVEITHDGKYLFAVNTASATISRYAIGPDGTLALIGSTPFPNGAGAVDARLSPDGSTLSVTGGRGHVVSVFTVNGSTLTEVPSSPTPLPADGTAPTGIVVT
jgi:6-phosphogluconolactonase (cycloisomerase 2 family)